MNWGNLSARPETWSWSIPNFHIHYYTRHYYSYYIYICLQPLAFFVAPLAVMAPVVRNGIGSLLAYQVQNTFNIFSEVSCIGKTLIKLDQSWQCSCILLCAVRAIAYSLEPPDSKSHPCWTQVAPKRTCMRLGVWRFEISHSLCLGKMLQASNKTNVKLVRSIYNALTETITSK